MNTEFQIPSVCGSIALLSWKLYLQCYKWYLFTVVTVMHLNFKVHINLRNSLKSDQIWESITLEWGKKLDAFLQWEYWLSFSITYHGEKWGSRSVWTMFSGSWCDSSGSSVQGQQLDLMLLVCTFHISLS